MYITKLVYSNIENFTQEEFKYLQDMDIIQSTDYGTTELLQETIDNLYNNSEDRYYEEEELKQIKELLETNVGTDVIELLKKDELDTVMFVYD